LRNSRISLGANISANWANGNGDTGMNINIGELPEKLEVKFDTTQGLPYLSAGILFDWFAPNSRLGFVFGVDYNSSNFQLTDELNSINSFSIKRIQVPFYLKWKFGKIHSKTNGLFLLGALYSVPIQYTRSYQGISSDLKDELQNTLSLSSMFGLQFRLAGKEKIDTELLNGIIELEYPRFWVFVRADMHMKNIFNPESPNLIIPNYRNDEIDYRDINISVGIAFFFGFK